MKNLKDTVTTICGIIIAICGAILGLSVSGIALPTWVITVCTILSAIAAAINGVLIGRNPNGSVKINPTNG